MNQRALVGKAVAVGQGVVNETLEQAINATHRYFLNHVFFEVNIHVHDVFMYDFTVHSPIWKLKSDALLDSTYSQFSLKKPTLKFFLPVNVPTLTALWLCEVLWSYDSPCQFLVRLQKICSTVFTYCHWAYIHSSNHSDALQAPWHLAAKISICLSPISNILCLQHKICVVPVTNAADACQRVYGSVCFPA